MRAFESGRRNSLTVVGFRIRGPVRSLDLKREDAYFVEKMIDKRNAT